MMTTIAWTVAVALAVVLLAGATILSQKAVTGERGVRRARRVLEATPSPKGGFEEDQIADLPEPAKRYFRHALAPGTPVPSTADILIERRVRTDKTRDDSSFLVYRIRESITTGRGSIGRGRVFGRLLPTSTDYWYVGNDATIRENLIGLIPLALSRGENTNRVMRSRILNDYIFHPAALLPSQGGRWEATGQENIARVTISMDDDDLTMDLEVDAEGRLTEAVCGRWGSVGMEDRRFTHIPFGLVVDEESTFEGITIPILVRSGWWYGTERYIESIIVAILDAGYR